VRSEVPQYALQDEVCVDPARTALVVVDMQNDFVKPGGGLLVPDAEATIPAVARLLALARASGMRVVYSQDTHRPGDPEWEIWPEHCREGSWGWEIVAELAPRVDDAVLRKITHDVFYGTPLDHLLRLWSADTLVICGTVANIGVQYAAGSAALRWYAVVIPRDAVSALEPFDLEASLRQTAFVFAGQVTTADGVCLPDREPLWRPSISYRGNSRSATHPGTGGQLMRIAPHPGDSVHTQHSRRLTMITKEHSLAVRFQTVDGVRIRFADSGASQGPTLLMTSPWPESVYAFAPMWAALAGHARLFAIDLPGFGASERRDDLLSPRAMGGFLAKLIADVNLERPHIVAPDVGTSAALFTAGTHPERIASVTVGTGGAAIPIQLGEPLKSWVLDPDLDKYRKMDPARSSTWP
jgi:nicotinamidase-related amidase